jgi:hypothetical protein
MDKQTNIETGFNRGFMESIIQSNLHLFRTIIFMAAFSLVLCSVIYFSLRTITKNQSEVLIETTDRGFSLQVKKNNGELSNVTLYSFLLPSNDWWFNTGVVVPPNAVCTTKISGRVHFALHKLSKSTEEDLPSKVNWCSPEGNVWADLGEASAQDIAKRDLLLSPGKENLIGNVVGIFIPQDEISEFRNLFVTERKKWTKLIQQFGHEKAYQNNTDKNMILYLAVNDILFDFSSPEQAKKSYIAYTGGKVDKKYDSAWKFMSQKGKEYIQLWYDDNIGNFLVQMEVKTSSKD